MAQLFVAPPCHTSLLYVAIPSNVSPILNEDCVLT